MPENIKLYKNSFDFILIKSEQIKSLNLHSISWLKPLIENRDSMRIVERQTPLFPLETSQCEAKTLSLGKEFILSVKSN